MLFPKLSYDDLILILWRQNETFILGWGIFKCPRGKD
jgi:hypothetical protein